MTLRARLVGVLAIVMMVSGHLAECQGWMSSPEARMACCDDERECPLHKSAGHAVGSATATSQADADRCCAGSERGASVPSSVSTWSASLVAVLPVLSAVPNAAVIAPYVEWLEADPSPPPSVPRHALLSVFLI
ncbi:MAG: hypothetical protein ABMA15_22050 [Vicinamibacterales bacterium]